MKTDFKITPTTLYVVGGLTAVIVLGIAAKSIFGKTEAQKLADADEQRQDLIKSSMNNQQIEEKGYLGFVWDSIFGQGSGQAIDNAIFSAADDTVKVISNVMDKITFGGGEPDTTVFTNDSVTRIVNGFSANPLVASPSVPKTLADRSIWQFSALEGDSFDSVGKGRSW